MPFSAQAVRLPLPCRRRSKRSARPGGVLHARGRTGRRQTLRSQPEGGWTAGDGGTEPTRRRPAAALWQRLRAASRAFGQAVVADGGDAESWPASPARCSPSARGRQRRRTPAVNASGAAWNAYERAQTPAAKAAASWSCTRPSSGAPTGAPPSTRSGPASHWPTTPGAAGAGNAGRPARLPHHRVQGRCRRRAAAPVHPVQRRPGVRTGPWAHTSRSTAGTRRRSRPRPDLHRRVRPRQALRSAGARLAAFGDRRGEARQDGRACHCVKDRTPSVRVAGRGYVLPNRGGRASSLSPSTPASCRSRSTASATAASPRSG